MLSLEDYKTTCGQKTWDCVMHYRQKLRDRKVKMAFFSSTPQGGGVALMRHALVRFSRLAGVNLSWYGMLPILCARGYEKCLLTPRSSSQAEARRVQDHQEHAQHPPGRQQARPASLRRREGRDRGLDCRQCSPILAHQGRPSSPSRRGWCRHHRGRLRCLL